MRGVDDANRAALLAGYWPHQPPEATRDGRMQMNDMGRPHILFVDVSEFTSEIRLILSVRHDFVVWFVPYS